MIFTPQHIFEARRDILNDLAEDEAPTPELCHKLLALDPDDHIATLWLGRLSAEAGDPVKAESLFWQSLQMQPCSGIPYMELSRLISEQPERAALGDALAELGLAKLERESDDEPSDLLLAARAKRQTEPTEGTERLRHFRLLDKILEQEDLSASGVDSVLNEGTSMLPLLVAVLRAWASDLLGDNSDSVLENALALLGETGTAEQIAYLMEFVDLEHELAAGAARWALLRIVERQPLQARQLFQKLSPEMGLTGRLTVVDQIVHHRALDPDGTLLAALAENLQAMKSPERDRFFPLLLSGMVAVQGETGIRTGREVLRLKRTHLSSKVRRECEALLDELAVSDVTPFHPPASEWTVYDICQGGAVWDEAGEDGEENSEDDFDLPPEPLRRPPAPGRNDPCWCNSGKKYKKCHLDSDQRGTSAPTDERGAEFDSLRHSIGDFLSQALNDRERRHAVQEFLGEGEPDEDFDEISLVDWVVHDWISPRLGKSPIQEFLSRQESRLTAREREVAGEWARSFVSLYEVEDVEPGVGLKLRDVLLGGAVFAHDKAISGKVTKWDGLFARVVPGERGLELAGAGLLVTRGNIETLTHWMEEDRSVRGLDWRAYLKTNWARIRRQSFEVARNWKDSLRITNTDGEELVISTAVYSAVDETRLSMALAKSGKLEAGNDDEVCHRFAWLNDAKTVLGSVSLENGELRLETNSKERLVRGKKLLSGLKLEGLDHLRDEFQTAGDLKAAVVSREPGESEIPREPERELIAEYLESHFEKWPDTQWPALGGKTPRQAVRTASGRMDVINILHGIENTEERKRLAGGAFYDVSKLYGALGLKRV